MHPLRCLLRGLSASVQRDYEAGRWWDCSPASPGGPEGHRQKGQGSDSV